MSILKYLDKDNLHHAYLIEGARDEVVKEIKDFLESIDINTEQNPDFIHLNLDSFKIDDARNLKSFGNQKSFSSKKIFIISVNSFLLEAQNSLLKMFEEPIENTHFFLIVPDTNSLLKTFISRFYLISTKTDNNDDIKEAEKFIVMPLKNRIDFIKEFLTEEEEEDEEGNEIVALDSTRSKAIKFLNALEFFLHDKLQKNSSALLHPTGGTFCVRNSVEVCHEHILKVREFLRMPGSSTKTLLESVAIIIPNFKN